jgi:hypothetical protein
VTSKSVIYKFLSFLSYLKHQKSMLICKKDIKDNIDTHTLRDLLDIKEKLAVIQRYWCPILQDFTDPPRPKAQARAKGSTLHRLKDGGPLCGSRRANWYALPDELPTCKKCLELSQVTQ